MITQHIQQIAAQHKLNETQVQATAELLEGGATIPFIARYRKEKTGSLDEVALATIRDDLARLKELDARRDTILKTIHEQGKLTEELRGRIMGVDSLAALEDLYLPYKPKRRTRATVAKEKGLEPLASLIFSQDPAVDPFVAAEGYVDPEKNVDTVDAALAGARDIMAEWMNEDQEARARMRSFFQKNGQYNCHVIKGKELEGAKYENYFDWQESMAQAPSHRVLAMRRGEKEGFLRLRVIVPEQEAQSVLEGLFVKGQNACGDQVKEALTDGYTRLLAPSIETEVRLASKKTADVEAIKVFAENLRQLLLAPPLGQKNVLAIDPGFRTGCKLVCLDRQGKLLHDDVIYPTQGKGGVAAAAQTVKTLCEKYTIEAIAIGNGTASRETEAFVRQLGLPNAIAVVMVNESGASVYSASAVAREEFPDKDVTVRGAVSIGRRLTDPLAELVKIDPKSIGVGQYQHDVDQAQLKQGLDDVVVSCVNSVGVELNTASQQLLTYVSGLGPQLARNIVNYRNENGPFKTRQELNQVPRLGAKAFEQAAGFLRIRGAANPLDASAVHPESYALVDAMASDLACSVQILMTDHQLCRKIKLDRYVSGAVGLPTLNDILTELLKPGRDPRQPFEVFAFADGIAEIEDVQPGMRVPGIVTNITAFGAFVDIGVHQDGLIHISEMSHRFIKDPAEVVKVQQKVMVTVLEVDVKRRRIALSLKAGQEAPSKPKKGRESTQAPRVRKPPSQGKGPVGDRLQIRLG